MRSFLGAIGAAFLCAACTPMQWVRSDATPEQVRADAAACQQAAWREAWLNSWHFRPITPYVVRDARGRPFVLWPHGSAFYHPFGDPLMEESRLAQFCMQSKGYRLEPVPEENTLQEQEKKAQEPEPAESTQPSTGSTPDGKP